jgi:hypothetical protein
LHQASVAQSKLQVAPEELLQELLVGLPLGRVMRLSLGLSPLLPRRPPFYTRILHL